MGWHSAADLANSTLWSTVAGVIWIVVMTWICYRGIELSARIQTILLSFEITTLTIFVIVSLIKVYANHPAHSLHVSAEWFNPFDLGWGALIDGVLLGIFIYWGWDSGVAVNEESENPSRGPGSAAVLIASHDLGLVKRLRKRVLVLDHGKLTDDIDPEDLAA